MDTSQVKSAAKVRDGVVVPSIASSGHVAFETLDKVQFVGRLNTSNRRRGTMLRTVLIAWLVFTVIHLALAEICGPDLLTAIHFGFISIAGLTISLTMVVIFGHRSPSILSIVVTSIACGCVLWLADVVLQTWLSGWPGRGGLTLQFRDLRLNVPYFCLPFFLQGVGSKLLEFVAALQVRERQLYEARLAALRFQLNPHLVFNSLNAVAALAADAGATQAVEIVGRLSDFMRSALEGEPAELVPLAREIDMLGAYFAIEEIRFGDRLAVRYDLAPGLANAQIPSLILQPLVENAVKYAVAVSKVPVTVSLESSTDGDTLILSVSDDGSSERPPPSGAGLGVGLANVAARLETLYGHAARLEVAARQPGFRAEIRMPLRFAVV